MQASMSGVKNIFVLGLESFHLKLLEALPGAENYRFHGLLDCDSMQEGEDIPVQALLEDARKTLDGFEGHIDAIISYWDFPGTLLAAILSQERGLRGASVEAVLKCEHKYWSRREQRKVLGEECPNFEVFDPFADDAADQLASKMSMPFWVKPIKSFESYLAFRVQNRQDLDAAIDKIRAGVRRIGEPFDEVTRMVDLPDAVAATRGWWCMAEEEVGGWQLTIEGYVQDGQPGILGVIDSVRCPNISSFARYQYPSTLPEGVQKRVADVATKTVMHLGLDNTTYNIEFFYDEANDRLALLEVNPRISQSHSDIFEKVDGVSNLAVMVDVALGKRPSLPHRKGQYKMAAKCFLRAFKDGLLVEIPSDEDVAAIASNIPGAKIELEVEKGQRLSKLTGQDSYSYRLAHVYLGADDEKTLLQEYREIARRLQFRRRINDERSGKVRLGTRDAFGESFAEAHDHKQDKDRHKQDKDRHKQDKDRHKQDKDRHESAHPAHHEYQRPAAEKRPR